MARGRSSIAKSCTERASSIEGASTEAPVIETPTMRLPRPRKKRGSPIAPPAPSLKKCCFLKPNKTDPN
ncbi:hypothetical protein ACLOJK_023178 [Asimina triloba]